MGLLHLAERSVHYGEPSACYPPHSIPSQRAWAESHSRCPLICLLSPGSDPTKLIEDLAKRKKIKTLGVSMGQGQEVRGSGVPLLN